jgi:hypothetical protein
MGYDPLADVVIKSSYGDKVFAFAANYTKLPTTVSSCDKGSVVSKSILLLFILPLRSIIRSPTG